jgi:predicted nuclease of predicted toxin-antitoxin system
MRFLLDHNVPNSVAEALRDLGHDVVLVREILPTDASDPLVGTAAEQDNRVLVSLDRDFQKLDPQRPEGHRARFKRLSRIWLRCSPARCAARLRLFIREIEWEEKAHAEQSASTATPSASATFRITLEVRGRSG